jgi:cell division ATPase FtsA
MLSLIRKEIEHVLLHERPSCVVLTGGGALLQDMDRVAEAALGLPARVGAPRNDFNVHASPLESTCAGLALYGQEAERGAHYNALSGALGKAREWAKNLFEIKGWGFGSKKPVRIHNP